MHEADPPVEGHPAGEGPAGQGHPGRMLLEDPGRDPDSEQPGQRVPPAALLPRVRDLGKEIKEMLAAGSQHGRRCHRRAGVPRGRRW